MSTFLRRSLIGVGLGVVLYIGALAWFGAQEVSATLRGFGWSALAFALGASSLNYLLRFAKWELCLKWLEVRGDKEGDAKALSLGRSFTIYIAGLSMSVTPGKVGEVLRSVLLRASDQVPFARTAPIVVADRATDLIALVLLSLVGIAKHQELLPWVVATIILVVLGVVVLGTPRLFEPLLRACTRLPVVGKSFTKAGAMVESAAVLLRLRHLLVLTVLSVVGWGLECIGYWWILNGFVGVEAGLLPCAFAWAATTIIGALSFLPGGLGATEVSLGALVPKIAVGASAPIAVASTLLIRAATLWYGVLVGGLCLAWFMRDPKLRAAADQSAETSGEQD